MLSRRRGQDQAGRDATAQVAPKQLRDTIALIAWLVPKRSRPQGGDGGDD
ncbi:hypothetical protein [Streptomyces sp. WZ-12]|nr:hypothetical protein [Streptomyces sp. WZ-12]